MSNFKNTLLMPETLFEMKANLSVKEPKIQEKWVANEIEKKVLNKNQNNDSFIIADGPPYANGNLHTGHALNKILKDIILRYKSLAGFYTKFIPGWDTHGLPIEQELIKKGKNIDKNLSVIEKRKNCKDFAMENVYKQMEQFKKLGILSKMTNEFYVTCESDYVIRQLKIFNKMLQKGLIFQDLKPVYWSWSSQTALADAEIIYNDVESDSIYVSFEISQENNFVKKGDKIIIWTTTPYTLPSNLAAAAHPKITYCRVFADNNHYVVAKNLLEDLTSVFAWENPKIENEFLGIELENIEYNHPLYDKKGKIVVDEYVSSENGTGIVHNAPGFGHEDYLACKKYGIKPFCPIDQYGKFTEEVNDAELVGLFYSKANEIIIKRLQDKHLLMKYQKIIHSAAHDWRTKKPIIYRATKQWFVNIKKIESEILAELNNVKSVDPSIIKKMKEMISNRQEWCISRQRLWGVPIPIIYKDNVALTDEKLMNNIIDELEKRGVDAWYQDDVSTFLTNDYKADESFVKEKDIMDVWFDSGTSYSVLQKNNLSYPADLYFEGKDQFRGWFNSSLITSVAAFDKSPYKTLLTHGFVLDDKGNKMSKSLGNVIDPLQICKEYGADILRIWVASVDYLEDVRISKDIIAQNAELYRRIRNTLFRFILGNLKDFDITKHNNIQYSNADLFILNTLEKDMKLIKNAYDKYDFKQIIKIVSKNVADLSSWYFDYVKDSLYCDKKEDAKRIAIQATLYHVLSNYLIALAPIIPHTCEEAYEYFNKANKLESVHLESFVEFKLEENQKINLSDWEEFFSLKDLIYAAIEKHRKEKTISSKGEALVVIKSNNKPKFSLETLQEYLAVAKVVFEQTNDNQTTIDIQKSDYTRCERCWNYYETNTIVDSACTRCTNAIK